jgi:hypothetical protein
METVMDSNQSQNQKPEEITNTSSPEQTDQTELAPQDLNEVQGGATTLTKVALVRQLLPN